MLKLFRMVFRTVVQNSLGMFLIAVIAAVFLITVEGSCPADQFHCPSGKCIRRSWFCDGDRDCLDGSDERYCNINHRHTSCPSGEPRWMLCDNRKRCYPAMWKCDGVEDCVDGSDERDCPSGIRSIAGVTSTERNLTQHLLKDRAIVSRSINKWSTGLTRIAVALFLNDRQFFAPGNKTGEEIAYELSLQLLAKLALKKQLPTNELTQFINALTVACINPKDFFGINMVGELRKRVNNSNFTSPLAMLTLCTAKDTMTVEDVQKLQRQYDAHFRPLWTDTEAMVVMALSCISSRSQVNVDERILQEMTSELKRKQHKNGTIDNLKTTALVVQALLAAGDYRTDFDISASIKFIVQEVRRTYPKYPNIQDIYYILPILMSMSMANISSDHCKSSVKTDLEVMSNLREYPNERIQVQVSVIVGDDRDFHRTWKVKVPSNYTLYQLLENIGTLEPDYKVQFGVSEGKPYISGLSKFQDDSEDGFFWFIYTKPLSSTGSATLVEESPVDIPVEGTDEFILWYRSGYWTNVPENSTTDKLN